MEKATSSIIRKLIPLANPHLAISSAVHTMNRKTNRNRKDQSGKSSYSQMLDTREDKEYYPKKGNGRIRSYRDRPDPRGGNRAQGGGKHDTNSRKPTDELPSFDLDEFKVHYALNINPPEDLRLLAPPSSALLPEPTRSTTTMHEDHITAARQYLVPDRVVRADLKSHTSDFIVQEIDQDGVVATLGRPDALDLPAEDVAYNETRDKRHAGEATHDMEMDADGVAAIKVILGDEIGAAFGDWVAGLRSYTLKRLDCEHRIVALKKHLYALRNELTDMPMVEGPDGVALNEEAAEAELATCREVTAERYPAHVFPPAVGQLAKEVRRDLHHAVRKYWEHAMVSDSIAQDGHDHQLLRVSSVVHGDLHKIDRRSKQQAKWYPGESRQFLVATLEKRNRDTNDALTLLGRLCGVNPRQIGIAGTKDKRAITTQNISFFRVTANRVHEAMSAYYARFRCLAPPSATVSSLTADKDAPDMVLGNFRYSTEKHRLGMLWGNRFSVKLRNMDFQDDAAVIDKARAEEEAARIAKLDAKNAAAISATDANEHDCIPMQGDPSTMTSSQMRRSTARYADHNSIPYMRGLPLARVASLIRHLTRTLAVAADTGFINYFGSQRFGTSPIATHYVGLALLLGDYKRALELILMPRPNEAPPMRFVKSIMSGKVNKPVRFELEDPYTFPPATNLDLIAALRHLPNSAPVERVILKGLGTFHPRDYKNIFSGIMRTQQSLYVNAYQSYIFNAAATARFSLEFMKDHPGVTCADDLMRPLVGDVVLISTTGSEVAAAEPTDAADAADAHAGVNYEESNEEDSLAGVARTLTEADILSGRYTLHDVVFPMVMPKCLLPDHAVGSLVRSMLHLDGLYFPTVTDYQRTNKVLYSPAMRIQFDNIVEEVLEGAAEWNPWMVLTAPGGIISNSTTQHFRTICRKPGDLQWSLELSTLRSREKAAAMLPESVTAGMHPSRLAGLASATEADARFPSDPSDPLLRGDALCTIEGGDGKPLSMVQGGETRTLSSVEELVQAVGGLTESLDADTKELGVNVDLSTHFNLASSTYATTLLREILKAPATQSTRPISVKLAVDNSGILY